MERADSNSLARFGYQQLGLRLTPAQVADVYKHLAARSPLPGYVAGRLSSVQQEQVFTLAECQSKSLWACYRPRDVISTPHLLDAAIAPDILAAVRAWLCAEPVIYSMNVFWTFPRQEVSGTQIFHRDFDEARFVAVFFYLTDFTVDDGAQRFVIGSHDADVFKQACDRYGTLPYERYRDSHKDPIVHGSLEHNFPVGILTGLAGTCVMMLPSGLHCGGLPRTPRLLAWVRYGTHANSAYVSDRISPVAVAGWKPTALTRLIVR